MGSSVNLGIAVALTVLGVLAVTLSFATDHWAMWRTNDELLQKLARDNPTGQVAKEIDQFAAYHTRHWGLFRICFPLNSTGYLGKNYNLVDGKCLNIDYELPEKVTTSPKSEDYWTRIHVMRCQFAFMVFGIVLYVFAFVTGTWACWRASQGGSYLSGFCDLIGAVLIGGAMGCFHGVDYLEENKLMDLGFRNTWPEVLKTNSSFTLAWSYMIGWIGTGLGLIAALFYLIEACNISHKKKLLRRQKADINRFLDFEDRKSHINSLPRSLSGEKSRSPLYEENWENANRLVPVLVYDTDEAMRY